MKITLLHKTGEEITIYTPHDDPDAVFEANIKGRADLKEIFKAQIERVVGYYGHTIDLEFTSNLDLLAAVTKLPSFDPVDLPEIKPRSRQGVQM